MNSEVKLDASGPYFRELDMIVMALRVSILLVIEELHLYLVCFV